MLGFSQSEEVWLRGIQVSQLGQGKEMETLLGIIVPKIVLQLRHTFHLRFEVDFIDSQKHKIIFLERL